MRCRRSGEAPAVENRRDHVEGDGGESGRGRRKEAVALNKKDSEKGGRRGEGR